MPSVLITEDFNHVASDKRILLTGSCCCLIQPNHSKDHVILKIQLNEERHSPNKVRDDEKLDDTVDDADGPALHYHRLGGFVGEKVCYTRPHPNSLSVTKYKKVNVCVFSVCDITYRIIEIKNKLQIVLCYCHRKG